MLSSRLEDKDVERDDEVAETGPDTAGLKFATNAGGGAVVTVAEVVGTTVELEGVGMVGVNTVGETPAPEIPRLETGPLVDEDEVIEGMVLVGDGRVLRVCVVRLRTYETR